MKTMTCEPLTADVFAAFGDVISAEGAPDKVINQGLCDRFHDRARLEFGSDGRAGISVFRATPCDLPLICDKLERHPDGAQCFLPLATQDWLVIVAPDVGGRPGPLRAFRPTAGQGVNILRNVWHGALTSLSEPGLFAVVDRIGPTPNLEVHDLSVPVTITG